MSETVSDDAGNYAASEYMTVLIVTHFSQNEAYGGLSPPSSDLVETTVRSAWQHVSGVEAADHHLYYNYPTGDRSTGAEEYAENLRSLSKTLNVKFHQHPNHGLRQTLEDAVERVETPYILFLEHDWEFISEVALDTVLETFEHYDEVNSIRFNKRPNEVAGWDTIIEQDDSKPLPLCKVSTVSNNPHISRTETLKQWLSKSSPGLRYWYYALKQDTELKGMTPRDIAGAYYRRYWLEHTHVPVFDDMEKVIDTKYKHRIKKYGFERAHNQMGTYLYGPEGSGPYVNHLGR